MNLIIPNEEVFRATVDFIICSYNSIVSLVQERYF